MQFCLRIQGVVISCDASKLVSFEKSRQYFFFARWQFLPLNASPHGQRNISGFLDPRFEVAINNDFDVFKF